jgi:hypothetical protein
MHENKLEQLFSKRRNFYYTRSAKHAIEAYEKHNCCLKAKRCLAFVFEWPTSFYSEYGTEQASRSPYLYTDCCFWRSVVSKESLKSEKIKINLQYRLLNEEISEQ